jgi:hypothetical protein
MTDARPAWRGPGVWLTTVALLALGAYFGAYLLFASAPAYRSNGGSPWLAWALGLRLAAPGLLLLASLPPAWMRGTGPRVVARGLWWGVFANGIFLTAHSETPLLAIHAIVALLRRPDGLDAWLLLLASLVALPVFALTFAAHRKGETPRWPKLPPARIVAAALVVVCLGTMAGFVVHHQRHHELRDWSKAWYRKLVGTQPDNPYDL